MGRNYKSPIKKYLKPFVNEAMDYYIRQFSQEKNERQRKKKLQNIKFFQMLHEFYDGMELKELSYRFGTCDNATRMGIRNAEARVERYLIIKSKEH